MKKVLFLVLCLGVSAWSDITSRLNITEQDGSPSTYPYKAKFANGTVTDNGDGTVSISGGSGGGSPSLPFPAGATNYAQIDPASLQSGAIRIASGTVNNLYSAFLDINSSNILAAGDGIKLENTFGTNNPVYISNDGISSADLDVSADNISLASSGGAQLLISGTNVGLTGASVGLPASINTSILNSVLGTDTTGLVISTPIVSNLLKSTNTWSANQIFKTILVTSNTILSGTTYYADGHAIFPSNIDTIGGAVLMHFVSGVGFGVGKIPTLPLDISGSMRGDTSLSIPVILQATAVTPAVALNASGANFGLIQNQGKIAWCLGFGGSSTANGTCILNWDSTSAVTVFSSMTVLAPTTGTYELVIGTNSSANFNTAFSSSGFMVSNGPSPVISSCGSSPSGSVIGDDARGVITVGGTAPTACTLTFAVVHTGCTMSCNVNDNSLTIGVDIASLTTSVLTLGFGVGGLAAGTVWYHCSGFGNTCR